MVKSSRPLVILVVADQALSLIRLKQLQQKASIFGTEFGSIDFQALALARDQECRRIDNVINAGDTLEEAINLPRPVLVEARVDKTEYDRYR